MTLDSTQVDRQTSCIMKCMSYNWLSTFFAEEQGAPLIGVGSRKGGTIDSRSHILLGINTGADTCTKHVRSPTIYVDMSVVSPWIQDAIQQLDATIHHNNKTNASQGMVS